MSNQTFPVVFGNQRYMVDPNMMFNASRKFAQLVQPFGDAANRAQLVIQYNNFSQRSVDNFLKLVQGLPTDVLDSEMKEICEIAKMFQADQIYNTGLSFVQNSIDPSFFVPDNKYENGQAYLIIEEQQKTVHNIRELDFDSEDDFDDMGKGSSQPQKKSSNTEEEKPKEKESRVPTQIYEIRIDRPMMKCNRYHFMKNGQTLLSAKKKGGFIVIGKGADIHLKTATINHCAQITQDQMFNTIQADGQKIILKYIRCADSGAISMNVSFLHNGSQLYWFPKEPRLNLRTGGYGLKLSGAYHHTPVTSKRNAALKNAQGRTTFIVRKMGENFYEAECHPDVSPTIVFAIALSSIVGPSIDVAPSA